MASGTWTALPLAALLAAPAAAASIFDPPSDGGDAAFRLSGLLDVRYARTSQQRSWLEGGAGKLRYGGADLDGNGGGDRGAHVAAVPQASLVLDAEAHPGANVHIQLNLDADTASGQASLGVIEAFGELDRRLGEDSARLRLGAFIPPISLEHPGPAWSTRHTLTPSAIGSWIGEDVRAFGAEGTWERRLGDHSAAVKAAVFGGGDQTATVLLTRGWALHDWQAPLDAALPLPNGNTAAPFRELDGRPGWYGRLGAAFAKDLLRIEGGYWDNNGDPDARSSRGATTRAVWSTQFKDVGARLKAGRFTVMGHYLLGRTSSIAFDRRYFHAWYGLASARLGPWLLSGRYDDFRVYGWEEGYAATGAIQREVGLRQRLSLEYVYLLASPSLAVRPASRKDQIAQLNYRFLFGG